MFAVVSYCTRDNTLYLSLIVLYVGLLTVAAREVQCRFFVQIHSVNCFHFLI